MLCDPKKAAIYLIAMGWLLAASGPTVHGAGFSAKRGGQQLIGYTKSVSAAAVKTPAKMTYRASKKTWRGTGGKLTPSFVKKPVNRVLGKNRKAKRLRRAAKMYAMGEAGLAGKYASAAVVGAGLAEPIFSSSGKKRNRRKSP